MVERDDAVQEAWLRLHRSDTSDVANLRGWLTTVVARVCLDMLRSRKARREEPIGVRGAREWAKGAIAWARHMRFVQPALVDGAVGLVLVPRGKLVRALALAIRGDKIAEVEVISDPARLAQLDVAVLAGTTSS